MNLYFVRTIVTGNTCSKWIVVDKICQDITNQFPDVGEIKEFSSKKSFQDITKHFRKGLIEQEKLNNITSLTNASNRNQARSDDLGITLSIGAPDYQPIMLLERALRASAAVCRLTRSFEIGDLEDLIGDLQPLAFPEICRALEKSLNLPDGFVKGFANFAEAFKAPKIRDGIDQNQDIIPIPYATGFLVGRNYLLTNHHVLNEAEKSSIDSFRAQFRYERDLYDRRTKPIEYKLDSNFCISNPELDFALVALKDFTVDTVLSEEQQNELTKSEQGKRLRALKDKQLRDANLAFEKAGDNFGWFWLNPNYTVTPPINRRWIRNHFNQLKQAGIEPKFLNSLRSQGCLGEPVCIIQHPRGRKKEIVLFNNRVTEILGHSILYEADADFGSSGSPILNADFQVVGIHSGAVIQYEKTRELTVYANVGTATPAIVGALKDRYSSETEQKTKEKLNEFLINYVDVPEELRKSKIFLLGGRQRGFPGEAELTSAIVKAIVQLSQGKPFRVIDVLASIPDEFRQQKRQEFGDMSQSKLDLKTAIAWINSSCEYEERYQPGDVALELLTDRYDQPLGSETNLDELQRGFTAYYFKDNKERRSHADVLLDGLQQDILNSVSRGSRSDLVTQPGRLAFCRDIYMPSLVLYLGFLENQQDQKILGFQPDSNSIDEAQIQVLAKSLYSGLISWSKALSPIRF